MKPQTWKALLVAAVLLVGSVLALPNLFPSEPVLQIGRGDAEPVDDGLPAVIGSALERAGIETARVSLSGGNVLVSFSAADARGRAAERLAAELPDHVVAFASRKSVPAWMTALSLRPVSLGLDLRGGVYFLYEVDLGTVTERFLADFGRDAGRALHEAGIRHVTEIVEDRVRLELDDAADADAAGRIVRALDTAQPLGSFEIDTPRRDAGEGHGLVLTLREQAAERRHARVMEQNVLTLRNRIDELGLAEPVVAQSGANRIMVQVPGARDPAQLRRILSSTATIEWRLQDTVNDPLLADMSGDVPRGSILRHEPDGTPVLLSSNVIASGEHLDDAMFRYRQGVPVVSVRIGGAGAARMLDATRENLGRPLGVVLIEETRRPVRRQGQVEYRAVREETVIFLGRIDDVFSSSFALTGLDTLRAQELALLLRSGALAAPIYEVRHGSVGATLGAENVRKGRNALIVGFAAVMAFMAVYYGRLGWIANCALLSNVVLVVGLLSALRASLTLPGIAGIVLTVGMAVDANVLIFERIRESRADGKPDYAAVDEGYGRALSTIADANVTTLIAAAVLFGFGTGPVRGFAVTLGLGVLTSMFTAVVGTRVLVDATRGRRRRRPRAD